MKPMKGFQPLDDADFWDTHSAVDPIDHYTIVGFGAARNSDTMTVRFAPDDMALLRELAAADGVSPRVWLLQFVTSYLVIERIHPKKGRWPS